MSPEITEELIGRQPPEAAAIIRPLLAEFERLRAELASLKKTPRNSSQPRGTEHPHAKPPAPKRKANKRRGGQPGHEKHERALIPTEECSADDLVTRLPEQGRLNIDETPHKQGPLKTWLWTFVASTVTVFALRLMRKAEELYAHVGEEFPGVVGRDRYAGWNTSAKMYVRLQHRQSCWAHLRRDFQALIDSGDGQAKRLGQDLKRNVDAMFGLWKRVRDGHSHAAVSKP